MSKWTDWVMIGIVVLQAIIAGVINAQPGELGLPEIAVKWLAILNVGFVVLANQLKALGAERQPPKDPNPPAVGGHMT